MKFIVQSGFTTFLACRVNILFLSLFYGFYILYKMKLKFFKRYNLRYYL